MRRAARDLFEVLELMASEGRHPVKDVLAASPDSFTEGSRYPPPEGVQDAATGSAWYYHAHERPWDEHGHFHCFRYAELVRPGATPIALPDEPELEKNGVVHLAALCVDANGLPMRLFTINQWASGEWMYPAREVAPLVEGFRLGGETALPLVSRWLSAMLGVCQPQIAWLLHERDRVLADRRALDPAGFAKDRSIEITSALTFDLDAHLAALDTAWSHRPDRPPT